MNFLNDGVLSTKQWSDFERLFYREQEKISSQTDKHYRSGNTSKTNREAKGGINASNIQ